MGVYIRKMKMPKTCADCELLQTQSTDDWVGKYCPLVKRYIDFLEATEHRYVDCPIVAEIQEPHGRLIDELRVIDAIHERLEVLRTHEAFRRKHGDIDLFGVMPYIAKIPTVIETEGRERTSENKCKNCIYESLSIFEFPCDACYGGSWYEAAEGSGGIDEFEPIERGEDE